ncbi:helix-turn-helix domain-containing protein [Nonomuraea angiospora]
MTAAQVLGIGRTTAYNLAKKGEFPVHVIRIGDLYRVSTPTPVAQGFVL